jgi:S-formylglutathione hydrolase FrmB
MSYTLNFPDMLCRAGHAESDAHSRAIGANSYFGLARQFANRSKGGRRISPAPNCEALKMRKEAMSGMNWRRYDACAPLQDGARVTELLVDQGTADQFLAIANLSALGSAMFEPARLCLMQE